MWIALLALIIVISLVWVLAPLLGLKRSWAGAERASVEQQLHEERARLLRSLKDLEHEHEAGTIGDDEYAELRNDYLAETAAVYRRLEEIGASVPGSTAGEGAA